MPRLAAAGRNLLLLWHRPKTKAIATDSAIRYDSAWNLDLHGLMRPVAIGRRFGVLAHAKEIDAAFLRCEMKRAVTAVAFFMRAVAKRLSGRQTARTKAIINARLKLYLRRCLTANFGELVIHKGVLVHSSQSCNGMIASAQAMLN